jgi:ElaB/YqjD/DUF883 family membrane-anchored ribosome-binding protein
MKQLNTVILVIVVAVLPLATLGIGFFIRKIRLASETDRGYSRNVRDGVGTPLLDRGDRMAGPHLSDEEIAELREQKEKIIEKMANLSEEEEEKFRAQIRERFRTRWLRDRSRSRKISTNEAAKLKERWRYISGAKEQAPDDEASIELDAKWRSSQEIPTSIIVKQTEPNDQKQLAETGQEDKSE